MLIICLQFVTKLSIGRLTGVLALHLAHTISAGPTYGVEHHDGNSHDGHPDGVDYDALCRQSRVVFDPAHRMHPG